MPARIGLVFLPIALMLSLLVWSAASAATLAECQTISANHRPATADDAVVKNGQLAVGVCYNPNEVGINRTAEEAKQFLLSRYVIGPRSAPCIRTKEEGINGLNPDFAIRAVAMIQAMERELGGRNIVRSAVRPLACGGGVGHSNGCAIDVEYANARGDKWRDSSDNPNVPEVQWIRRNGSNTQFRLHFPFPYPPEWHHIEPMDRASCLAGRSTDPTVAGVQSSPSSGFANQLRNALGMPQQPMMPPMPSQPLPQQQSPLGAFGSAPLPQPSQPQVSDSLGTPIPTPIPSVSDQLWDIINGTTSVSYSTTTNATTAPIVITRDSAGTIISVAHSSATPQYGSGSLQPVGQQTFGSGDSSAQQPATPNDPARYMQILMTLKTILLTMLEYLQPFKASSELRFGTSSGEYSY